MKCNPRSLLLCFALPALAAGLCLTFGSGCGNQHLPPPKPPAPRYPDLGEKPNVPEYMAGTIWERVELGNIGGFPISGYGLVVNLDHTGDNRQLPTAIKQYMVKEMVKRGFGSPLLAGFKQQTPDAVLADDRVSVVEIDGLLPPGCRKGQQFDVRVSVLPRANTTSLAGGELYQTDLARDGADPHNPFNKVTVLGQSRGPVFVNPAYALQAGEQPTGSARLALRSGIVMNGGMAVADRPIFLRLRQPQTSISRNIEQRIINRFGGEHGVAYAHDEGLVSVFVPTVYGTNWQHFIGVVLHTYLNDSPAFETMRAKQLAEEAVKPDANLGDISYCWEALGEPSMPFVSRLLTDPSPKIAFAAARAAAFIGDESGAAQNALLEMARTPNHPFQLNAVQVLGELPPSPMVNRMLRDLVDSDSTLVRIEAYKILARNRDESIISQAVPNDPNDQKFILDVVPSKGPPLIYATRSGDPRIGILGVPPRVSDPILFSALNNQLTISTDSADDFLTIFYRDPLRSDPIKMLTRHDVSEIVRRLGGLAEEGQTPLDFSYAQIVAILQDLSAQQQLVADRDGTAVTAAFLLQKPPMLEQAVSDAPIIDQGRPQKEEGPEVGQSGDLPDAAALSNGRPQ